MVRKGQESVGLMQRIEHSLALNQEFTWLNKYNCEFNNCTVNCYVWAPCWSLHKTHTRHNVPLALNERTNFGIITISFHNIECFMTEYNFLPMQILERSGDSSRYYVPMTHAGDLKSVSGCWFGPFSRSIKGIYQVSNRREFVFTPFTPSIPPCPNKFKYTHIIFKQRKYLDRGKYISILYGSVWICYLIKMPHSDFSPI